MFNPSFSLRSKMLLLKLTAGLMVLSCFLLANPTEAATASTCQTDYAQCMVGVSGHDLSDPACCLVFYRTRFSCQADRCVCLYTPNTLPFNNCIAGATRDRNIGIMKCRNIPR